MAGFGAAHRLHAEGITPIMFDKNAYHGGHTASFRYESGFLFDVGPHISFTKDSRIQELFADSVEQQYETLQINLNNYWRGYWPKHPVQTPPSRIAGRCGRQGHFRLCGRAPGAGTPGEELCRLVAGQLWPNFRRVLPHAVHPQVPHYDGRQHEYRLAGSPHLPAEPGRGASWRNLSVGAACALHYAFPLSQRAVASCPTSRSSCPWET